MSSSTETRHRLKIIDKREISHDVNLWIVEKPDGFTFTPGQASHISLDKDGFRDKDRPFTFTSLPGDPTLEFVIKTYPSHEGVTDELDDFKPGDHLLLEEPAGSIEYRGEGTFIAGGAGVTPFIPIFKQLFAANQIGNNRLFFANEKAEDVFLKTEFDRWLGDNAVYVLSDEDAPFAERGKIDRGFLQQHCSAFDQQFWYLCGPPQMGPDIKNTLIELGADPEKIIHEDWS